MTCRFRWRMALALAMVSGSAGLTHQLLWTRRLVDLLGADAGTFAQVIGAFFAGIALGAWLGSRPVRRPANFWLRIAWAEVGVAALSVPVLFSAQAGDWIWGRAWLEALIPFLAPPLLVLPPAIFMGLVLPWLLRALADESGADGAVQVYGTNILGGIGGIGLVLYAGLPRFGLFGASAVAIGLNLAAAGMAAIVAWRTQPRWESDGDAAGSGKAGGVWWARGLAFISGGLVLSAEVVVQHQFAQVAINSMFSAGTVLSLVLGALWLGAMLVPRGIEWLGSERRVLWAALWAAALFWMLQPFLLVGLTGGLQMLSYDLRPSAYVLQVMGLGMATVGVPFVAAGVVFPLVLRSVLAARTAAARREAGLLFAWNGLGGWLGAEAASAWIAPAAGLWGGVWWIAVVYWWLALAQGRTMGAAMRGWAGLRPGLAVGGLVLGVTAALVWTLPQAGVKKPDRIAQVVVAREGVVTVVERASGNWRMLFNNTYALGGSGSQFNQERQAHLPLLLHGGARSAALMGVATGSTTAGAALHAGLERIDAIELSPAVLRFARDYFGPFNRGVLEDPRVRVIQGDARRVMARERAAYDVVIGDLFLPWRTGEGRLFAVEHFENVRLSLRAGGLYCQWLPMFQLTRAQYETITRTFQRVFPDAFLIRGDFYAERPIVGLVGGRTMEALDWDRIGAACALLRHHDQAQDPLVRHPEGVAMLVVGPLPMLPDGPVNTLANAWVEWDAGQNILGRQEPWFVGRPFGDYAADLHQAGVRLMPSCFRAAHEAGLFFGRLELAGRVDHQELNQLMSQAPNRMPMPLAEDDGATWGAWPMRTRLGLDPGNAE
jgi:spermidine synthase